MGPNEEELANIVSKIPGSSHCADEDVNDCLNCDSDDTGWDIMTDNDIVDNLRGKEVTADDNEDDVDEEEQSVPSYKDASSSLGLSYSMDGAAAEMRPNATASREINS